MSRPDALLPRESLLWIFAAQFTVLLPHFARLPLWVVLGWVVAVLWRIQVYRGIWEYPSRLVKLLAVSLALAGLVFSYRRWFALEPMVALLAVSFALKNLELVSRRDAFLSLLLAYFVAATLFVFEQTIPYALYGLLAVVLVTAALAAQQGQFSARPRRALGLSMRLLAQSIPLMLLLFVVIPRLGPLWAVPQKNDSGSTGVSDSMSPGDFTELSKSDQPALRIAFDGPLPPPDQRYWRGVVYSHFDGRRWSQGLGVDPRQGAPVYWLPTDDALPNSDPLPEIGPRYRYRVIQEPSNNQWLFAMARPYSETPGVGETRDDRLVRSAPVYSRFAYEVKSWPRSSLAQPVELGDFERRRNLQLPEDGNMRARSWARSLAREQSSGDAISRAVLEFFNSRFTYTLKPPALGADSVDEFLFESQQGFCEHFAGSYVFLMRAAGVPARVVAGYQGGEWVEQEEYLLVRQYDAHAWAEIWTPARGWHRVDPTAAVSPERIRDGLQSAAPEEFMEDALLPIHRISLLNRARLQWDMINYRWYQAVVSFDSDRQENLLRRLLGQVSPMRLAALLLIPVATGLVLLLLWLWWGGRSQRLPRAQRLYLKFCRRMARAGIARRNGEAPRDFVRRIASVAPGLAPMASAVTTAYERAAYAEDPAAERQLGRLLRHWRMRTMLAGAAPQQARTQS
ncbi:protein-glutamine gamma-glutamyltransferase [Microbulbifer aestuariivivens]|uniref:Protein-glutamine gamma-glutamyltransferase n=1 Tax=Microbulbifer aestuariivivens TaxID=1908308 RepID=A0ABP9WKM1_9GAMM